MSSNSPIRVAYLVHEFATGGIERCIVNLVNNAQTDQLDPIIVCLTRSGDSALALDRPAPVHELDKGPGWDRRAVKALGQLLSEQHVQVLHTHNWGTLIEGSLARKAARVPVHVHTEHGQGLHSDLSWPKKVLRRYANLWAFRRLSRLCVCARCVAPLLEQRSGFPAAKIGYLPNGVPDPLPCPDHAARAAKRQSLGIPEQAFVFGSTGRMVDVKGFELAIEATARLSDLATDAHLILVGDGAKLADLCALAEHLGVQQRVHFVGHQVNVGPWLNAFDLFVNTSKSEAMSLSLLEGMAARLPVVACDVGDNREIVIGHTPCGLIHDGRDAKKFAEDVHRLAQDESLRLRLGDNARAEYERLYSVHSMVQQHVVLYRDLLGNAC